MNLAYFSYFHLHAWSPWATGVALTYCILKGCVIQPAEATLVAADIAEVSREGGQPISLICAATKVQITGRLGVQAHAIDPSETDAGSPFDR